MSLDRVVQVADLGGAAFEDLLERAAHLLGDGVLAGQVGVGDREVATVLFGRVTVDRLVHLVAVVAGHPVVCLVEQNERGPLALDRAVGRGDGLKPGLAAVGADQLRAVLDAVDLLEPVAHQRGDERHRVCGLRLIDRGDLDPRLRVRVRDAYRLTRLGVPVGEPRRADQFDEAEHCEQGGLTPALHPLEDALPVDEPAPSVDRVPPQNEPELLRRELPRSAVLSAQVLRAPTSDLPAECEPWKFPGTKGIAHPRGAEERRFKGVLATVCLLRRGTARRQIGLRRGQDPCGSRQWPSRTPEWFPLPARAVRCERGGDLPR